MSLPFAFGSSSDSYLICDLPISKCVTIAYDAKFSVLVEAAGEEGLRFRPFCPEPSRSHIMQSNSAQTLIGDVMRYLTVPTSHIVFTPYNMLLCCHLNRLSMVRHCTGRLIYETALDCCSEISGAAFDSVSDTLFISDVLKGCIFGMKYMEFCKTTKLDLKFSVSPGALCIFSNFLLISNKHVSEGYCGLCYKLQDQSITKISRIQMNKVSSSSKQQRLAEAFAKQLRPTTLNGIAVLPQIPGQNTKATMLAISEDDHTVYTFKMRLRNIKESGAEVKMQLRCKSRDTSNFTDREGSNRIPRSVTAISSEYMAVHYEVYAHIDSKLLTSGILVFRMRQS